MIFSPRRWTLFVEPAASSLRAFQRAKTRPSLREDKNFEEAALKYKAALHLDPNYANAHNNLGLALYNQGKLDEAIASYRKGLQIDPNDADAHNNLGYTLYNQGKLDDAIAELEIAVHLEPTDTVFRKNLESVRNKKKGFWGRLFGE